MGFPSHHHAVVEVEHNPQAAADHEENQDSGEGERDQIFPRLGFQANMQEEAQMHQDLDDGKDHDDAERG
jgi:hypothetical protein